jgi:hypothetical protein
MSETVNPAILFDLIGHDIPGDLHPNILIVGSLAAAYHYKDQLDGGGVHTKDADIVIQPAGAIDECRRIAARLLEIGWRRTPKCYPCPVENPENPADLRLIRLHPPDSASYFVELLGFPDTNQQEMKKGTPIQLDDGWYQLDSFRFLGLAQHGRLETHTGLQYAAPAMMALSNLLSHPKLGTQTMGEQIGITEKRTLLRSAKDLGRVLALAWFAGREATESWPQQWEEALRSRFGDEAPALARRTGDGLRELLASRNELEQARFAVDVGLLAGLGVTEENLRLTGEQFLVDAIGPLARRFAT